MQDKIIIRNANTEEIESIIKLVGNCPPLEQYPFHIYKIMVRYFGDFCHVAIHNQKIVGWVMGFPAQKHLDTCFLWQIGVTPEQHGQGIGKSLLKEFERTVEKYGYQRIEATIDPENISSKRLFERYDFHNNSQCSRPVISVNGSIAAKDFYGPDRHFMIYEKILKKKE